MLCYSTQNGLQDNIENHMLALLRGNIKKAILNCRLPLGRSSKGRNRKWYHEYSQGKVEAWGGLTLHLNKMPRELNKVKQWPQIWEENSGHVLCLFWFPKGHRPWQVNVSFARNVHWVTEFPKIKLSHSYTTESESISLSIRSPTHVALSRFIL